MDVSRATELAPVILVVDDDPYVTSDVVRTGVGEVVDVRARHPDEVTIADLETADLVLVDYRIDDWPSRDEVKCLALQPLSGISLLAILREHLDSTGTNRNTAFALHSGRWSDLRERLPFAESEHIVAKLLNIEWVFPKGCSGRFQQMVCLANSFRRLPRKWPKNQESLNQLMMDLLGMGSFKSSVSRCWDDVKDSRPPFLELSSEAHGAVMVRWLLHEILPYPTFLIEKHWVAARLRMSLDAFDEVMRRDSDLSRDLQGMTYSGILSGFIGERWWRGALEDYVWELTLGTGQLQDLKASLSLKAGYDVSVGLPDPCIVCLDTEFRASTLLSPTASVRVRPDHWPPFASEAWMPMNLVLENPELLTIVDPLDADRIQPIPSLGGEAE